jgi:hypothetical protein
MVSTVSHAIPHAGLACLITIVRVSSELLREDMIQLPHVRITVGRHLRQSIRRCDNDEGSERCPSP